MKKLMQWIAATVIIGSVLACPARAAESASVLLQKGIFAEETEGNLDAAIKIYEQIATEAAANRAVVAQAQYRLAVCYQKKGSKEQAIATLNELLKQFPSEGRLSQMAREILAELGQTPTEAVTIRKLPLADASWVMSVSPDGRFIAYMDQDYSSIFIYETASAKTWQAVKADSEGSWSVVFSPDASHIAYDKAGAVWVAKVDGTDPRELFKPDKKLGTINPIAWSSASGNVLASLRNSAQNFIRSLVSLDAKTGEMKEIMPSARNSDWSLSSDGHYLAQRIGRKVTVIDLTSRKEQSLVEDHVLELVGWSHNDSEFLFSSDQTGAKSLWTISMKSGQPSGEPRFVKEYADGAGVGGVTRDGRIYYTEDRNSANVFLVSANFETGDILGELRRVTDQFPGVQTTPAWSKDGQKLFLAIQGGQRRFVAVSVPSGQQQDFPMATLFDKIEGYSWSKDGTFLLVAARKLSSSGGTFGIHRFEPASGKVETMVTQMRRQEWLYHPQLSPGEKSFYFRRQEFTTAADGSRDPTDVIIRRDLGTKQEEIVYQPAKSIRWWKPFELSPDGSRLAIVDVNGSDKKDYVATLKVLTLSGGGQKEVIRLAPRENVHSLAWTPDGKRLVYTKETPNKEKKGPSQTAIWSTAIDSGQSVTLKLSQPDVRDFAIHPDGRQIAFQTGSVGDTVEVSVMEGLIPKQIASNAGTRPKAIAQGSPAGTPREILLNEISGPNNTIFDRKLGVTATLPAGWSIQSATRHGTNNLLWPGPEGFNDIMFSTPEKTESTVARMDYQIYENPRPMPTSEVDAWLRVWTTNVVARRRSVGGITDYNNRQGSFVSRTVGGRPALSWVADFTRDGAKWTVYWTLIRSEKGHAAVFFQAPTTEIDASRPAYESLVESVRLDAIRTANASPVEGARIKTIARKRGTEIPLEEISGPNNSILERTTGVSAKFPAGWNILAALRDPELGFLISTHAPEVPKGVLLMSYHIGQDKSSVSPAGVDARLRKWSETTMFETLGAARPGMTDYKHRPASFVSRVVNDRRALSWIGDYTLDGDNKTEYATLIHSEKGFAFVRIVAPPNTIESLRSAYESLVESVRLP